VGEAIDDWLAGKRNLRPNAQRSYADSLELAKSRLGNIPLQKLTRARLDALITELQETGRRVGNVKRQGLSPRSINLMLTLLGSVLDSAVRNGLLARNVAKMVERPKQAKKERETWKAHEVRAFLTAVASDRLSPAWRLSFYGLRRGEVLGLCWSDIDLDTKTLIIRRARVDFAGEVVEVPPKTERSGRALPLEDGLVAALRSLKTRQRRERLEAGKAYSRGCGACARWHVDCPGDHVVVDEIGRPVRPERFSDRFKKLFKEAGLPTHRLHDAGHTSVTLMILSGVPIPVVSKWHGHATAAFTNGRVCPQPGGRTGTGRSDLGGDVRLTERCVKEL
jgi:integrase